MKRAIRSHSTTNRSIICNEIDWCYFQDLCSLCLPSASIFGESQFDHFAELNNIIYPFCVVFHQGGFPNHHRHHHHAFREDRFCLRPNSTVKHPTDCSKFVVCHSPHRYSVYSCAMSPDASLRHFNYCRDGNSIFCTEEYQPNGSFISSTSNRRGEQNPISVDPNDQWERVEKNMTQRNR